MMHKPGQAVGHNAHSVGVSKEELWSRREISEGFLEERYLD